MATTIKTKNSTTGSTVPTGLVQGELAVNITDKKLYVGDAVGNSVQIAGQGATNAAGGSNTQVQYNSSGALAGSSNMTFSGTALTLANDASISGLTVGRGAGAVSTATVVGYQAMNATNSGAGNSVVGYQAMYANTSGAYNSAFGKDALGSNTTGSFNTSIGYQSLISNTTASNNTAVGYQSGYSNTTGTALTFMGRKSGYSNTVGTDNTFIGDYSGYTTAGGSLNSALGSGSLQNNTSGANNTALGAFALALNTTASQNTAVGYQAGYVNTGASNCFIGYQAGVASTTGSQNTYLGYFAGGAMTTGSANTIVGRFTGNQGGLDIRTSSNYIVLSDGDGNPRGIFNDTGFLKVKANGTNFYGFGVTNHELVQGAINADVLALTNSHSSAPYGLFVKFSAASPNNTTNYFAAFDDSTNTKCIIYSNGTISNRTGTYNTISDAKLKENIVDATPKLDKLMQVQVRNYNLIGEELKQIGFVAQELETVFPSLVENCPDVEKNENGEFIETGTFTKNVKSSVMIPILVKAIQELKAEVDSLKAQLNK